MTPFRFDGRRVVVAGGSRGIGRAIPLAFVEAGAAALEATRAEIAAHGGTAHAASCDLSDAAAIVNIASGAGIDPAERNAAYGASKAAVVYYPKTQAATLMKRGIRVNCIAPGSVEFPGGSWEQRKSEAPELYNRIVNAIPAGRLGRPEEIAPVVLFFASPLAGWMTPQVVQVNGGQGFGR